MVIKVWNNWDGQVFKINISSDGFKNIFREELTPEEQKMFEKIKKKFVEELCLEFVHNLKEGWEEKLLQAGRVLSRYENKKLTTKAEIKKELTATGEINFFAEKKFGSWKIIKKLRKPKHLCRD